MSTPRRTDDPSETEPPEPLEPSAASEPAGPASRRVQVRRGAARADYDPGTVRRILDEGLVAHVGVVAPDGPLVLPMAYGRIDDTLYLHGARANGLLAAAAGAELCVTVTLVDGLVLARSPFHNSMNYRAVVVRARGALVTDDAEKVEALRAINDRLVPTWDTGRQPTASELRRTAVVGLPVTEASAKVRAGDPVDEASDLDGPHWAGTVARHAVWGPPRPARDLSEGVSPPPPVARLEGRAAPT